MLVVAACLVVAAGYVSIATLRDRSDSQDAPVSAAVRTARAALGGDASQVVFQLVRRDDDYAHIAIAPAASPRSPPICST